METKKIKGLTVKFTEDCMTIEDSYQIKNIDKMVDILNESLEKTEEYFSARTMKSFVNEWIAHNKFYKFHLFRKRVKDIHFKRRQNKLISFVYSLLTIINRFNYKVSNLFKYIKIRKNRKLYKKYIKNHKANVIKAYDEIKENPIIYQCGGDALLSRLYDRVLAHDDSKYSKEEFEPYRKNFFPINQQEKDNNKVDFEKAWEHHWKNNSHHWQYRQNKKEFDRNNMEDVLDVIENVLDWIAMGYHFNDRPTDYYNNNKEHIVLNDDERKFLEYIIEAVDANERTN